VAAGCYEPKSGYADPRATVYALSHRAKEMGAGIEQLTEVVDIRRNGDRVTAVVTNHGEISTPIVVNCDGTVGGQGWPYGWYSLFAAV
jgi:glycine/D-amino acid oxidase-like deaminating enzyme